MDDKTNQTAEDNAPVQSPAGDAPQTPATPPADQDKNQDKSDAIAMAKELGEAKAQIKAFQEYQAKVDPVIQTLWSDEALFKHATEVYNKKLGVTPEDKPPIAPEIAQITTKVDNVINSEIAGKINSFYVRHGVDKLDEENKQNISLKVGALLMEMLDPRGNKKDLRQVLEDVPLAKLDKFLEDAYYLATKDETLEEAKNQGKQEATSEGMGMIGSIPSSSINSEEIALNAQQKATAKKMGISEENYLKNLKEITTQNNQLYPST